MEYEKYEVESDALSKLIDALVGQSAKYFNELAFYGTKMRPIDIEGLRSDNEYLFGIKTMRNVSEFRINLSFKQTLNKVTTTIDMINNELISRK